jgi:hypothetical protein
MRNALLVFLVLNFLAYAYQSWIIEPAVIVAPDYIEQDYPALPLSEKPAERVVTETLPAASAVEEEEEEEADVGMTCIRIGPFPRAEDAAKVHRALKPRATRIVQSAEAGQVWGGYWVQTAPRNDRAQAEEIRQSLIAAGMEDAYIVSEEGAHIVSIGLYRKRASAKAIVEIAQSLGHETLLTDRFHQGTNYWLRVSLAGNGSLRAGEFQTDSGQILRTESVPCSSQEE